MISGLLIQVSPFIGEGLVGYLHRLAEENGLGADLIIEEFKSAVRNGLDEPLAVINTNEVWRQVASELMTPSTQPMPLWNLRRRRFCARCLSESAYWRAEWDLSLVTACLRHKVQLTENCQHCGHELCWRRNAVGCCPRCGQALTVILNDSRPPRAEELWLTAELVLRMQSSVSSCSHLAHLNLQALHELAFRLGSCGAAPRSRKPVKIANSSTLRVARPIACSAGQCLNNWPHGLFSALRCIQNERGDHAQWKLEAAFGPILREVFEQKVGADRQFVRDAFEDYLRQHWQGPLAFRHRRLDVAMISTHKWLPVKKTSKQSEVRPALLARIADTGQISSKSIAYENGRHARLINSAELCEIENSLKTAVTAEEASALLGLSKTRIKQLIHANILTTWGGPPKAGARWWVNRDSVNAVIRCGANAPTRTHAASEVRSIDHLLRYRVHDERTFCDLMSSILKGTLKIDGKLDGHDHVRGWLVLLQQADKILSPPIQSNNSDVSVVEASRQLGIKQEVAYALVRFGILESHEARIGRRLVKLVTNRAILRFSRRYILGAELAKALGKSPKFLANNLRIKKIMPVAGPSVVASPCRQYCWRRSPRLLSVVATMSG